MYDISGVYTWGEILTMMCEHGFCRLALPRDFYSLSVPISLYEYTFEDAFKALQLQARSDGWSLTKSGKKIPYEIVARPYVEKQSAFISCIDSTVHLVDASLKSMYVRADSLRCSRVEEIAKSLASLRYRIDFYVVSSNFLRTIGVDWTEIWARGDLFNRPDLITDWTLTAVALGDTSAEFRSVEMDVDSAAYLHWGSKSKEEVSTFVSGDVVRSNYEYYDYGLTLRLHRDGMKISGDYKLAQRDDLKSVIEGNFGGDGDSICSYGIYDSYSSQEKGVPFLSSIPLVGYLFRRESVDKVKAFFVIRISLADTISTRSRYNELDSLKNLEWSYDLSDSTDSQSSSVDTEED